MASSCLAAPARSGPGVVALVDDDPHIAHALSLWLQIQGCAYSLHQTAGSLLASLQLHEGQAWVPVHGPQALDPAAHAAPEAMAPVPMAPMLAAVMDLTLPDLSGVELARHLQALGLQVPLVVITAASAEEWQRCGALPEGVRCLRKPFRLEELEQALQLTWPPAP